MTEFNFTSYYFYYWLFIQKWTINWWTCT